MDVRERVGLNVQKLRRAKGLSQEELADRAKIHQTYLSGVERGIRNPTVVVLHRLPLPLMRTSRTSLKSGVKVFSAVSTRYIVSRVRG